MIFARSSGDHFSYIEGLTAQMLNLTLSIEMPMMKTSRDGLTMSFLT